MPIEPFGKPLLTKPIFEGVALLAIAPWLLFPSRFPVLTLAALISAALVWLWPWLSRRKPLPVTAFNAALLVFVTALTVGILASDLPILTLPKATGVILGLTTFRYIISVVQDEVSLKKAELVLILVCLGFIAVGILGVNWSQKAPFLAPLYELMPEDLVVLPEAPGEGINANQLAGILILTLPLSLSLLLGTMLRERSWLVIVSLSLLAFFAALLLLLTLSRAGWIGALSGAAAVLLLWLLLLKSSPRRRALLIALVIVILLFVVTTIAIGEGKFGSVWGEPDATVETSSMAPVNFRLEVWKWALAAIEDLPLTGTGLGTFRQTVRDHYPIGIRAGYDIGHAHNILLQVALDAGLPALVSYLSILLIACVVGWRVANNQLGQRALAVGLLSSLFALHIYGLADALALGSKPGLIFWLMLGLLGAMGNISDRAALASAN